MSADKKQIDRKLVAVREHQTQSSNPNKHLSFKKISKKRLVIVVVLTLTGLFTAMTYYWLPFTKVDFVSKEIPFETKYIDDNTIELGQHQERELGENGVKEEEYRIRYTLAGQVKSRTLSRERVVKSPVAKTVANGTKKYQFMWCSSGSYRYYSNDEFKKTHTGFTHQSPDFCAQNGQGHMTSLADAAPIQQPSPTTYRSYSPSYYSPTTCRTQYNTYGGYFDPTATTTCY